MILNECAGGTVGSYRFWPGQSGAVNSVGYVVLMDCNERRCDRQNIFWHVYFFSHTCQVCAPLWTCFGMFISSAALVRYVLLFEHVSACLFLQLHLSGMPLFGHVSACLFLQLNLSGMCCFLDMFRHVYFFSCTCQVCASL